MEPARERRRGGNGEIERLHNQPTGVLIRELLSEGQRLIHEEGELVKEEIKEQARGVAKGGGVVIFGVVAAVTGLLILAFAVVFALALVMPLWLAALIMGAVLVIGGALASRAGFEQAKDIKPHKAIAELKEDKRWASETMHRMQKTRANA